MTAAWKIGAEADLIDRQTPAVLTTGMLEAIATTGRAQPPSKATFQRWCRDLVASHKLREVTKGVYLNRMGHSDISPAAAACWIRARAWVSLTWVLEQAGVTNNISDTITCVIPIEAGLPNPQISSRHTAAGTFRFFALPARLVELPGALEDFRDMRFDYPRATPEKALLDMIHLGASPRSHMTRPPLDIEYEQLDRAKVRRLARRMTMLPLLEAWLAQRDAYLAHPDVRDNTSSLLGVA